MFDFAAAVADMVAFDRWLSETGFSARAALAAGLSGPPGLRWGEELLRLEADEEESGVRAADWIPEGYQRLPGGGVSLEVQAPAPVAATEKPVPS